MKVLSIGQKIILMVSGIVTVALAIMMSFYMAEQKKIILSENSQNLAKITTTVSQALQTVMLSGYAEIAEDFNKRLGNIDGIESLHILKTNGLEAFNDNKTINHVNKVISRNIFIPREKEAELVILAPTNLDLEYVVETHQQTYFYSDGEQTINFLMPVINQQECQQCHGDEHKVNGVIYISSSLVPVYEMINASQIKFLMIMGITLALIILMTSILIRRTIVLPVKKVTLAMSMAAEGDLSQQVPVPSSDEIGAMASSFNLMISKLLSSYTSMESEQHKLATIILSTREGVVVTNSDAEIVLVNPAAERLLGKTAEQIKIGGLMNLVDDQALIEKNLLSDITSEIHCGKRIINLYASVIKDVNDKELGSAVLLREVTHEKELEDRLRKLAITDELTGLYNRRHLDILIAEGVARSSRYKTPLSILFFDIDHFKLFNDNYGHNQGDRVLKAVAELCGQMMRDTDKCCRYGGEEFLVILPSTNQSASKIFAERLRLAIENMLVDGLKITISIGIAEFPVNNPITEEQFISLADKALYKAKDGGRNRVVLANNETK